MQERRSNPDRTRDTRAALVAAARALFLEKGFAATGTPEIAESAGVTRGALYHHYKDKQDILRAVIEAEATGIAAEIEAGATDAATPLDALIAGAQSYFRAMRAPGRTRLMLLEGPAVLGSAEMRRIDMETGGQSLRQGLEAATGPGLSPTDLDARADLLSAMFDRAALAIEAGGDPATYEDTLATLLTALIKRPSP
ncbi:MAG TPA: TetR/AcrR family transcriptional regulator [Albidovulum sp.]|uniref:TetR/AcrR family transcriptional regulator n=1 Tax=Albidovulum sp. TaxID=1872424 RepID=UPI002C7C5FC9|nr:TetR/AcrR family transcriptional regulator [Albidovulum sp.]